MDYVIISNRLSLLQNSGHKREINDLHAIRYLLVIDLWLGVGVLQEPHVEKQNKSFLPKACDFVYQLT
ncbi:MAG: hypothetical protein DRR16_24340 [Candidatus Parabeggiatoa sp. nov. 3]|nr:MAG: hypothetical protein DRR16_24340 [Gammaproteobacteria bacterium]